MKPLKAVRPCLIVTKLIWMCDSKMAHLLVIVTLPSFQVLSPMQDMVEVFDNKWMLWFDYCFPMRSWRENIGQMYLPEIHLIPYRKKTLIAIEFSRKIIHYFHCFHSKGSIIKIHQCLIQLSQQQ